MLAALEIHDVEVPVGKDRLILSTCSLLQEERILAALGRIPVDSIVQALGRFMAARERAKAEIERFLELDAPAIIGGLRPLLGEDFPRTIRQIVIAALDTEANAATLEAAGFKIEKAHDREGLYEGSVQVRRFVAERTSLAQAIAIVAEVWRLNGYSDLMGKALALIQDQEGSTG